MTSHPHPGRRNALMVFGFIPVAWWLVDFVRVPPRRLIDRLLDLESLHLEHGLLLAVAIAVLVGIPAVAAWLTRPGRGKRPLQPSGKFLIVMVVVFALWLPAEVTLRVLDHRRGRDAGTAHYGPGPDLAHHHRWLQEAPAPGELGVNRARFRGPDSLRLSPDEKPSGTLRVFTLGEQSTFLPALPVEETWPALLEKRLAAAQAPRRVEVQNASWSAWTSQHSLIHYVGRVQDFAPDVVVLMHGPMDLVYGFYNPATSRRPFDAGYSHNYGPLAFLVKAQYVPHGEETLLDHSRAFWYARRALRYALYGPPPPTADAFGCPGISALGPYPSLPCYERNVRTLAALCRAQGRQLVLMTHPQCLPGGDGAAAAIEARFGTLLLFEAGEPVTPDVFLAGLQAFNDATRRLAAEANVPLIDLDRTMSGREEWFADPWAFNAAGCRAVAEAMDQGRTTWLPPAPSAGTSSRASNRRD